MQMACRVPGTGVAPDDGLAEVCKVDQVDRRTGMVRRSAGAHGRETQRQRHVEWRETLHDVVEPVDRASSVPIRPADASTDLAYPELSEQPKHAAEALWLLPVLPL